MRSELYYAAML